MDTKMLGVKPRRPEVLSSTNEARAVVLALGAGESLQDHQVHERAWVVVIDGEVLVTTAAGARVEGGAGLLVEFDPRERRQADALADARILLLLTPWPGAGHPGAMTMRRRRTCVAAPPSRRDRGSRS